MASKLGTRIANSTRGTGDLFKSAASEFAEHNCNRMAAAIAYYTVFSLPALLVLVVSVAGLFVSPEDVEGRIQQEIRQVVGDSGAEQIHTMLTHANRPGRGLWGMTVGVVVLLFGATGVMTQLQAAMNEVWEVKAAPNANRFKSFLFKRVISLGMLLSLAFLLLVSLTFNAALSAVGQQLSGLLPEGSSELLLQVAGAVVPLVVVAAMFAMMYRYMPDVRIEWRDVIVGALLTAVLFTVAKGALAIYLGRGNIGSTYGAAGSLALIMVWIYFSSMIFLFGAAFTRAWRRQRRGPPEPESGAVRVN